MHLLMDMMPMLCIEGSYSQVFYYYVDEMEEEYTAKTWNCNIADPLLMHKEATCRTIYINCQILVTQRVPSWNFTITVSEDWHELIAFPHTLYHVLIPDSIASLNIRSCVGSQMQLFPFLFCGEDAIVLTFITSLGSWSYSGQAHVICKVIYYLPPKPRQYSGSNF